MSFIDGLEKAGKFGVGPMGLPDLASVGGIQTALGNGGLGGGGIGGGNGITSGPFGSPGTNAGANGAELALKMAMMAAMA